MVMPTLNMYIYMLAHVVNKTSPLDFVPSLTCQVQSTSVGAPPPLAWEAQGLSSF